MELKRLFSFDSAHRTRRRKHDAYNEIHFRSSLCIESACNRTAAPARSWKAGDAAAIAWSGSISRAQSGACAQDRQLAPAADAAAQLLRSEGRSEERRV